MSKKYVPSFIRDTTAATTATSATTATENTNELPWSTAKSTSRYSNYASASNTVSSAVASAVATTEPTYQSRFAGGGVVKNKFSTLSDDYSSMPPLSKPSTTATSTTATTVGTATVTSPVTGTLASLTSTANQANTEGKKSYASKFSDQAKANKYPSSKPPVVQKVVDVKSESEFPSLMSSTIPKNNSSASLASNKSSSSATSSTGNKFADLAKSWAQQTQEEKEAAALEASLKLKEKEEYDILRGMIKVPGFKHKKAEQYVSPDDMEDEYNQYRGDDYLGNNDEDDDIVPSGEEESTGDELDDDENAENEGQGDDYWR